MKATLLCLGACVLVGHTVSGLHVDAGVDLNVSAPLNVSINSMAAASALAKQYYEQQTPLDGTELCDHCTFPPRNISVVPC